MDGRRRFIPPSSKLPDIYERERALNVKAEPGTHEVKATFGEASARAVLRL
jgi:hypothetical protein